MNANEAVSDKGTFAALSEECNAIFDTSKRMPEFVFRRAFDRYFAIEYAYVYEEQFGLLLSKLSTLFEDESIHYMLLDPKPGDDYFRMTSYFGAVSFKPASSVEERYMPVMSMKGNLPRVLVSANAGVFWGSSRKWAIHCDRISWETAVIAVPENVDVRAISSIRCLDAMTLSSYMESQYHWKLATAAEFCRRFLANYQLQ
jgi:hypothetical protein